MSGRRKNAHHHPRAVTAAMEDPGTLTVRRTLEVKRSEKRSVKTLKVSVSGRRMNVEQHRARTIPRVSQPQ